MKSASNQSEAQYNNQNPEGKFFVLGVGAQKAGTTWLESQLSKTDFFSNSGIKEFHVFDKLATGTEHTKLTQKFNLNKHIKRRLKRGKLPLIHPLTSMRISPSTYFDFFDYLYLKNPSVTHVGDITPSYSTLSPNLLSAIHDGLLQKGFNIKVIFLMRDPAERVWSQLRMRHRYKYERTNQLTTPKEELKQLKSFYKKQICEKRTRYEITSQNLESVFPSNNIFYGFYESIFCNKEFDRLINFLECPNFKPDFNQIVHASPKHGIEIDGFSELMDEIRSYYSSTYDWAFKKFQDSAPIPWKSANQK